MAAAVTPTPANGCIGKFASIGDEPQRLNIYRKCLKSVVEDSNVYSCTTMKLFYANCPKINYLCNAFSSAYVAANTVCRQGLF